MLVALARLAADDTLSSTSIGAGQTRFARLSTIPLRIRCASRHADFWCEVPRSRPSSWLDVPLIRVVIMSEIARPTPGQRTSGLAITVPVRTLKRLAATLLPIPAADAHRLMPSRPIALRLPQYGHCWLIRPACRSKPLFDARLRCRGTAGRSDQVHRGALSNSMPKCDRLAAALSSP